MYAYNCTDMDGMNCSHLTTVIIFVMVGVLEHPKTGFISDVGIIVGFFPTVLLTRRAFVVDR